MLKLELTKNLLIKSEKSNRDYEKNRIWMTFDDTLSKTEIKKMIEEFCGKKVVKRISSIPYMERRKKTSRSQLSAYKKSERKFVITTFDIKDVKEKFKLV